MCPSVFRLVNLVFCIRLFLQRVLYQSTVRFDNMQNICTLVSVQHFFFLFLLMEGFEKNHSTVLYIRNLECGLPGKLQYLLLWSSIYLACLCMASMDSIVLHSTVLRTVIPKPIHFT